MWNGTVGTVRSGDAVVGEPLGYMFDPCVQHDDCIGELFCVQTTEGDCPAGYNCLCHGLHTELCNANCSICANYPFETCLYKDGDPPTDPNDPGSYGVCASAFAAKEGISVERGCDSFPEVTPFVEVDRDDYSDPVDATIPPMVPAHSSPQYSPPAVPSVAAGGAQEGGGACIDAAALAHLDEADWVFRTHRAASVLCDGYGSCATAGHVVVFRGRPWTMREYCALAGVRCARAVRHVNSVRMKRRGVRIKSRTPGMEYTALAARFETGVERVALKMAVRLGL